VKAPTILSLRVGELVANINGTIGKVERFDRDRVHIAWNLDGNLIGASYTDAELVAHGVVSVEGQ
jgi:preprotein translocase subunit YajC